MTPITYLRKDESTGLYYECDKEYGFPVYTHPAKTQLSNGHLSDCAIHNEPASRNKDCDCGFEPKFNLEDLTHEDNCRYFDDGMFCTCGSDGDALVEWYRHKEITHPAKTLTDEEILEVAQKMGWRGALGFLINFARAILKKASEK
jgi:hypothetical protein